MLAGDEVNGPFSAYAEAQVIDKHAREATGGRTHAELDCDDPLRETAVSASFLRASPFTSVVAFGLAAMAAGLGLVPDPGRRGADEARQGRRRRGAGPGGARDQSCLLSCSSPTAFAAP